VQRYQAKVILVERDLEKWYPSVTVLLEGMSGWKGSVIAKLDHFSAMPDYVALGSFGWGYLRPTNGSDLLEMVILGYGEHYKRMRHLVPRDRILNYELGQGREPLQFPRKRKGPLIKFPNAEVKMITVMMSRLEEARGQRILPFLGLVWAVVMSHFFSAEATICTLDLASNFPEVRAVLYRCRSKRPCHAPEICDSCRRGGSESNEELGNRTILVIARYCAKGQSRWISGIHENPER
jgi:hypothetical protein